MKLRTRISNTPLFFFSFFLSFFLSFITTSNALDRTAVNHRIEINDSRDAIFILSLIIVVPVSIRTSLCIYVCVCVYVYSNK